MKKYFELIRIKSWVKNGFLLLPLIFSLKLTETNTILYALHGVLIFCLASSFIYIINDVLDANVDALHPRKKSRPIASGAISKSKALILGLGCLCGAVAIHFASQMPCWFGTTVLTYLALNLAYSFYLKTVVLVELLVVSTNFVLRVLAGCFAISVAPSNWILVVTFFLSLLLVVVKRKSEMHLLQAEAFNHRVVLKQYTLGFLNGLVYLAATVTITAYLLYSMDPQVTSALNTQHLIYSTFFVVIGILRLILISETAGHEGEGDPTVLLFKDRFIQLTIICWIIYLYLIIYGLK